MDPEKSHGGPNETVGVRRESCSSIFRADRMISRCPVISHIILVENFCLLIDDLFS